MPPKRKSLTLVERVKVIELNNKNGSARKIAKDFGVRKTQVPKYMYMYIFLTLNEYNFLILNAYMITAKTCTAFPSFTYICGIMKYNVILINLLIRYISVFFTFYPPICDLFLNRYNSEKIVCSLCNLMKITSINATL